MSSFMGEVFRGRWEPTSIGGVISGTLDAFEGLDDPGLCEGVGAEPLRMAWRDKGPFPFLSMTDFAAGFTTAKSRVRLRCSLSVLPSAAVAVTVEVGEEPLVVSYRTSEETDACHFLTFSLAARRVVGETPRVNRSRAIALG